MADRVLFIALGGRRQASSRIRAWQVVDAWGVGAECTQWNGSMPDCSNYDVIVVQKLHPQPQHNWCANLALQLADLRRAGKYLIWDLCDAIWWWRPEVEFHTIASCFDDIVVSNAGLQDTLLEDLGYRSTLIIDRLPFQSRFKQHRSVEVPKLVWYGYASNRAMNLNGVLFVLERLLRNNVPFVFRVIDDGEMQTTKNLALDASMEHIPWDMATVEDRILECDVALIPPYPGLWGRVKESDHHRGHKAATAAWLGLPVCDGENYQYIKRLLTDWMFRTKEGQEARKWASESMEVHQSVVEWQALIRRLCESAHQTVYQPTG